MVPLQTGTHVLQMFVPWLGKDFSREKNMEVWWALQKAAEKDGARVTLKGRASHKHEQDFRKLTVISVFGREKVHKWLNKIMDKAEDAGLDLELFEKPEQFIRTPDGAHVEQLDLPPIVYNDKEDSPPDWGDASPSPPKDDEEDAPPGGDKVVWLVSTGFQRLAKIPEYRAFETVSTLHRHHGHPLPDSLFEAFLGEARITPDLVVNCTSLDDPAKTELSRHLGLSIDIQERIWELHPDFWQDHLAKLKVALRGKKDNLIYVFCRSGKHRSVAIVEISKQVLQLAGFRVKAIHEAEWWWRFVRCQRERQQHHRPCPMCDEPVSKEIQARKGKLYRNAYEKFRDVGT